MFKVSIIGSGNVAHHLIKTIASSEKIMLRQVFARRKDDVTELVADHIVVSELAQLQEADLYLIVVSDAAIAEVSASLPFSGRLVAHTSGAMGLDVVDGRNHAASFYPLQTFSKSKAVGMQKVPICIESSRIADFNILKSVADAISDEVHQMDSAQRHALHLAAVFASNFTNHMYAIASDICRHNNIDFSILKPLINETANKVVALAPEDAQTGPARRNDEPTINKHLSMITDSKVREIYSILSNSISEHGKKL